MKIVYNLGVLLGYIAFGPSFRVTVLCLPCKHRYHTDVLIVNTA